MRAIVQGPSREPVDRDPAVLVGPGSANMLITILLPLKWLAVCEEPRTGRRLTTEETVTLRCTSVLVRELSCKTRGGRSRDVRR